MMHRLIIALGCTAFGCVLAASCTSSRRSTLSARPEVMNVSEMPREFSLPDDFFPIMTWELAPRSNEFSDQKHGLQSVLDCGFTLIGFARPADLAQCEKLGMKAIVAAEDRLRNWRELSDQQIENIIERWVKETHSSKAVIGYFLMDEPGVRDFPALGKAVAAVKKFAPGKLAYINLYPDYATLGAPDLSQLGTKSYDEYLERFVREVRPQIISYDNYRVQYSNDMTDANPAAGYYANLLTVRRVAQAHDLPFWNIVSSNQIRKTTPPPSPANMLFQAYTTLAAGASGLTWYTYYGGGYHYAAVEKSGSRTASWSYLKMTNDQVKVLGPIMRQLKSTGVYFTSPAAPSLPALPGKLVQAIQSDAPIMIGEFSGPRDAKYVMLVNGSLQRSAKVNLTLTNKSKIVHISPVDGSESPLEEENSLWLGAGQGALLRYVAATPASPSR